MDLYFEKGTGDRPKGHALLFFHDKYDPEVILVTYILSLPIKVDVSKYIPPMFANQMQGMTGQDLSGFAFPPLPEKCDSLQMLRQLADARDDDLISGGPCDVNDSMNLIQVVSDFQQEYTRLWEQSWNTKIDNPDPNVNVNDIIYDLMSDGDKLNELSKLMGKLRFATDGSDERLTKETEDEIITLAKYLPEHYWISRLIKAIQIPNVSSAILAQLYLERCYKLYEEDYARLQEVEKEIQKLEKDSG